MVVIVENPHFGDKFGPTPLLKLSWSQPKTPTNGLSKKKLMIAYDAIDITEDDITRILVS